MSAFALSTRAAEREAAAVDALVGIAVPDVLLARVTDEAVAVLGKLKVSFAVQTCPLCQVPRDPVRIRRRSGNPNNLHFFPFLELFGNHVGNSLVIYLLLLRYLLILNFWWRLDLLFNFFFFF